MDVHQFTQQAELICNCVIIWHVAKINRGNKKVPHLAGLTIVL